MQTSRRLHDAWLEQLQRLVHQGQVVGPRKLITFEELDVALGKVTSLRPLLTINNRKLNYRFAVAEWLWIFFGLSDVRTIEQYNPKMRDFSDDGMFLTGAYGPHVHGQWTETVMKLTADPSTRQAVIEIPRPRKVTKDEPCTLSLQFFNRFGGLHCVATMRSSDIWLGLPYDCFTFMQLQNILAGQLSLRRGWFSIHLGSSHLYRTDLQRALEVLKGEEFASANDYNTLELPNLPGLPPEWLRSVLESKSLDPVPTGTSQDDPWLPYARALVAPSNTAALDELRRSARFVVRT